MDGGGHAGVVVRCRHRPSTIEQRRVAPPITTGTPEVSSISMSFRLSPIAITSLWS